MEIVLLVVLVVLAAFIVFVFIGLSICSGKTNMACAYLATMGRNCIDSCLSAGCISIPFRFFPLQMAIDFILLWGNLWYLLTFRCPRCNGLWYRLLRFRLARCPHCDLRMWETGWQQV